MRASYPFPCPPRTPAPARRAVPSPLPLPFPAARSDARSLPTRVPAARPAREALPRSLASSFFRGRRRSFAIHVLEADDLAVSSILDPDHAGGSCSVIVTVADNDLVFGALLQ